VRTIAAIWLLSGALGAGACLAPLCAAQGTTALTSTTGANADTGTTDFFTAWEQRASRIQADQPHWITPLVTVTPRLEQELRYDVATRTQPNGTTFTNYGVGKAIELIPFDPIELIIGAPPYMLRHSTTEASGWGDWPLLLKARILSANEEHGDYILTAFLGGSVPTGGKVNGTGAGSVTPTVAGGKGFGDFDAQGTFGVNLPTGDVASIGRALQYNAALQYRVDRILWPELELNGTSWRDGEHEGMNQEFITPGIVLGRLKLHDRLGLTFGFGEQIAVTHYRQYDHNWTLSARMPF
jgi:hypothetical protein